MGSFTVPHMQAYRGARYFLRLLEEQTADVQRRWAEIGGGDEMLDFVADTNALERQALSEAVQVFCAMAVEAGVNLLGLLLLGEEAFARLPIKRQREKLPALLDIIDPSLTEQAEELLLLAKRLADARNEFVHPKAREGTLPGDAAPRRGDVESAREAMEDVHIFFKRLGEYDRSYATFFFIW